MDLLVGVPVTLLVSTDDPVLVALCGLRVDVTTPPQAQGAAAPVLSAEPSGTTNSHSPQAS